MDEAPIEARVIDRKVLDYYSSTEETGVTKPYIVYLSEDKVEDAERKNRRRRSTKMMLTTIGLLSLVMSIWVLWHGLGNAWK